MVGHGLLYNNELGRALSEVQAACEAARKVGLVQTEISAQESLTLLLVMAGRYDEAEQVGARCLSLARPAGARRFESAVLYVLSTLRIAQRNLALAREHHSDGCERAAAGSDQAGPGKRFAAYVGFQSGGVTHCRLTCSRRMGLHGPTRAILSELRRLREEVRQAGLGSALPAIDAVLETTAQS